MDPDLKETVSESRRAPDSAWTKLPSPGTNPGRGLQPLQRRLLGAGLLSLLAWLLLQWLAPPTVLPWTPAMRTAAETMARALEATAAYCRSHGIPVDPVQDPAGTCLVGPQLTPLFTTLGQPEAKRTTLNPDVAALLVHLLRKAGVGFGDTVAVGSSASFPGLLVATMSATEALGAVPVPILSLGASSFGATRPEFHLLDLYLLLNREGIIRTPPAAVSLGGEGDVGLGFPRELRDSLSAEIIRSGVPFLREDSFPLNVARRMEIYCGGSSRVGSGDASSSPANGSGSTGEGTCPVAAFVNAGGAQANLGTSPAVLGVPAGLNTYLPPNLELPPEPQRGVLFQMAARGVPIIHLLHIRGLALKHGLPWDPRTIPPMGSTPLRSGEPSRGFAFWLLTGVYLFSVGWILFRRSSRGDGAAAPSSP